MDHTQLSQSLAEAFNELADEVQVLSDRKTVLEHKLRFAHEQFQYLADKYAPATPEIAETLAKLQLPPHTSVDETLSVPLPLRTAPLPQHQVALVIRDGRRVASKLASLGESSKTTGSSRGSQTQQSEDQTSLSTLLEQDFTVAGKKSNLQCPFSKRTSVGDDGDVGDVGEQGEPSHDYSQPSDDDRICAAMSERAVSQQATTNGGSNAASRCPIRFMDKHSPAEIAHYVETHKHELPRSHEICLRRYQRNETQVRKLDSKYGNIVSMIEDLSQLHQPMLPETEEDAQQHAEADGGSNNRVESWAHAVSGTAESETHDEGTVPTDDDRQSHFDRPLKEVRVGESPSRPWGISVPVYDTIPDEQHAMSPPPAPPMEIPGSVPDGHPPTGKGAGKCPFDHTKFSAGAFGGPPPVTPMPNGDAYESRPTHENGTPFVSAKPPGLKSAAPMPPPQAKQQPMFINPANGKWDNNGPPQMVFTGPVFIGYPTEQAIEFMNRYQGQGEQ